MSQVKSRKFVLPVLFLGLLALVIPLFNVFFSSFYSGNIFFFISLVPSFVILVSAYLIRFLVLDIDAVAEQVRVTCSEEEVCDIKRYIYFIFIAMNVGVAATVMIYVHFLAGAFIYLIKHIFLLIAFSGIINVKHCYSKKISKKIFYFFYIFFWFVTVHLIFLFFALQDIKSLILLPYGYVLAGMTAVAFLGLCYKKRSLTFRLMVAFGALVFIISDLCIMFAGPERRPPFIYLINPTYILAIFLLCFAQLFLRLRGKKTAGPGI